MDNNIITEAKGREYAFLMIGYDMPLEIKTIQEKLPDDIIYFEPDKENMYGKEKEPHVTLAAQLDNNTDLESLKSLVKTLPEYTAYIKGISLFNNEKYDVLKCDVVCQELFDTNKRILEKHPSYSEFKDYIPHMTIAYLKKGQGSNFIKNLDKLIKITPNSFIYSWIDSDDEKKITFEK